MTPKEVLGPSWQEFTAALEAQRADLKDSVDGLRGDMGKVFDRLIKNSDELKEWVKELKRDADVTHKEMKEDWQEEVKRLDARVSFLTGLMVSVGLLALSSLASFVANLLDLSLLAK